MKKTLLLLACIATFTTAKAQITLEHSYTTNYGVYPIKLEADGDKYMGKDTITKNLQIYNVDHSLWKTLPIVATGYITNYWGYASKYLFNSDNKIELLVSYSDASYTTKGIKIINEDGTLIMDFPNASNASVVNVAGSWKLIVSSYQISGSSIINYTCDVYSLPGTYSGLKIKDPSDDASAKLFPNPMETAATLQYRLPASEHTAQLSIYNSAGVKVKQLTVTRQFDNVTISRDELPAGIYLYDITTPAGTSVTSKFEIK